MYETVGTPAPFSHNPYGLVRELASASRLLA